jgi:methylmalonyl-CoA/ethylmalonyl-CoA epimerase
MSWPKDATFHHVGVACTDLDMETAHYSALGYQAEGSDFEDPVQGVRGRFLIQGGPRLELLTDLPGRSVVAPWLGRGIRMYHLAWEVPRLQDTMEMLKSNGARVVVAPVPAVAFPGRHIAFLLLPNRQLVEYIGEY